MRTMDITEHEINDVEGKQSSSLRIRRKKIKKIKMKDKMIFYTYAYQVIYSCIFTHMYIYTDVCIYTHVYLYNGE